MKIAIILAVFSTSVFAGGASQTAAEKKAWKEVNAISVKACIERNSLSEKGRTRIGMNAEDTVLCGWGKPERVNSSVGSWGTHEQWIYGGGNYLYIENGKVSSWSTSR
jgi:hypothetical protein